MPTSLIAGLTLIAWAATPVQTASQQMERALGLLASGQTQQAETALREIVREFPGYGPAHLQLGRIHLERQEWKEAEAHLRAATQSNLPRMALAWHLLGRVYLGEGDDDQARDCLRQSIRMASDFIPARLLLIEIAERTGDGFEALSQYTEVMDRAPALPERAALRARIALVARSLKALDLAECLVREAIRDRPEDGSLQHLLAVILKDAGRVDEALAACQKAIALGFREAPVYITLGDLYHEKMLLSESIVALAEAIALDPEAAESVASFALSSLTTEDYGRLREILETYVRTHPDNPNTLYSLAVMHLRDNELDEAKDALLHLKELVPDSSQVYYNLALVYSQEENTKEAADAMDRFRELKAQEDAKWERQNAAHARRLDALALESRGEAGAAIAVYASLVEEGTPEVSDFISLGRLYAVTGDHEQAFTWFERAIQAEPANQIGLEGLAQAAEVLDRHEISGLYRNRLELLQDACSSRDQG